MSAALQTAPALRRPVERLALHWNWLGDRIVRAWRWVAQTSRLAIGIGDYAAYRDHMRDHHCDAAPLTREAFFRDRVQARYGRGSSRCC